MTLTAAMPSVAHRRAIRSLTLSDVAACGIAPLVVEQPASWPVGIASQRQTARLAVSSALAACPEATHLLYVEDDVHVSQTLSAVLPSLMASGCPITLFLSARMFYPAIVRRTIVDGGQLPCQIVPVVNLRQWWGSQAVLLPSDIARALGDWPCEDGGWDILLKSWLITHEVSLSVAVPNLVQHRNVPSLACPGMHWRRSLTYADPD